MKDLSLWQPWASFIAIGVKPFETRDWRPPRWLIGKRIAIHAAKKPVSKDDREWAMRVGVADLPLGAIVCTALLAGAYRCPDLEVEADEFGDYAPGRWAWLLTDIERFEPAIPARGAQGLWDWHA